MQHASLAIIFDRDKKQLLLVKRRDVPVWVLPGGGIDPGETPEEAAIREVLEETGLRVSLLRKTGEYTPINRLSSPTHVYECGIEEGELQTGSETAAAAFWPLTQLPDSFFHLHRDWLEDALLGLSMPVRKEISQVTYKALTAYALRHPLIFLRFLWTRLFCS
jgi:8-oxo-dGTP diphosphatase